MTQKSPEESWWKTANRSVLIRERYEIVSKIGEGGFSETFLAEDKHTSTKCVLKILSWKDLPDWKVLELFEREARVLSQMNHPLIPRFIEFFTEPVDDQTKIILVQEYVAGKNLAEFIQQGKHYTEKEVIDIGIKAAKILEYLQAFSPPIIHRDIKPSNLLLDETGELHLVDFGAVRDKVLNYQKTEASGFTVVGTYGYMPFEQFQGQALPASDVYSLGMTLITLLSHKEPHEMELAGSDLDFAPYVNISNRFKSVLKKMIAYRLEDRYQTAREARKDLEALQRGQPVGAELRVGERFKVKSGTFLVLLLVLAIALFAIFKKPAREIPSSPQNPLLITGPAFTGKGVRGHILFDGQPVSNFTTLKPRFWFRDEKEGKVAQADAIYQNSEFEISGLPPGHYGMSIQIDLNQENPLSYPGDLRAWTVFTVSKESTPKIPVEMQQIIHLIQPEDNGVALKNWNQCCETGEPVLGQSFKFGWKPLAGNVFYDYTISRVTCPYVAHQTAASGTTKDTSVSIHLPPSNENEYYLLQLYARKEGRMIGMLMTHGANGYGWDYRFRVK
jgi:serine/threonine protein kinase